MAEEPPVPPLISTNVEERRIVSVLFVDMVGFTRMAGGIDPEDVRAVQISYFATVSEVVRRWGGVVEKYVGDAVMAVFGMPVSDGYDAYRAVRAGLRLPEVVGRLTLPDGRPIRVRVGIATGEALVDLATTAAGGQCLVSGNVVNMAARLQAFAAPDTVVVTAGTERQTRALVRYERLDAVAVAGRTEPLEVWRPLSGPVETAPDDETPLIGRAAELAVAARAVARAVHQGVPQLVSVTGAAGSGRSRLVRELSRYPGIGAADGVDWLVARCLPGGGPDRALLDLVRQGSRLAATHRPTVLVVEDRHRAGAAVVRFLRELRATAVARSSPLAVVLTSLTDASRGDAGDRAEPDGLVPECRIVLRALDDADTGRLLRHLLRRAGLPIALARRLLPVVPGNPMYAESYVRVVAERGLPVGGAGCLPVPEPVRAAVSARLDWLRRGDRRAVLAAAVLGAVVPAGALASLLGLDDDQLRGVLARLRGAGLLVESAGESGPRYAFVDPAVRAVAYARLTRRARAEYHRRAAEWFDAHPRARCSTLAGRRVRHWLAVLRLSHVLHRDGTPYREAAWRAMSDATRPARPSAANGRAARAATRPARRAGGRPANRRGTVAPANRGATAAPANRGGSGRRVCEAARPPPRSG
ncbi:hypothetical protein GCM10023322_34420 [Rugosimonospora acidiphila]|uniref:Guanylate cyclase domain-containing protein n=1 Tax=Rugosimonospora acidiphila TaxID=556531 RepID=A0ABP9RUY4_9ACTN